MDLVGTYASNKEYRVLAVYDDRAFIAWHNYMQDRNGVDIFDISDASKPSLVDSLGYNVNARDLVVNNDLLYLLTRREIFIYDPSDKLSRLKTIELLNTGYNLVIEGSFAFVLGTSDISGRSYVEVINISNPLYPRSVGSYHSQRQNHFEGFDVENGIAYLAMGSRVDIVDLRNPAEPDSVGTYTYSESFGCIAVEERTLFLGVTAWRNGSSSIEIVDVSNFSTPIRLASRMLWWDSYQPHYMLLDGASLLIGDVDISDRRNPSLTSHYGWGTFNATQSDSFLFTTGIGSFNIFKKDYDLQ